MKIKVNTNEEVVTRIREALKENGGYCPCALFQTPDTKCICTEFKNKNTPGECHCGLYVKVEE